ncbi:MAG: hypothetical protein CMJ67_02300, partial [Planctomycetaceae bacterium]|nr:hypothetical protein [Planctomycetaceae bacterium]
MRHRVPLIQVDVGWPFLVAGLAMLAAVALVPQQEQVREAEDRWLDARDRLVHLEERYEACKQTVSDLKGEEPGVMLRLGLSRLRQKPAGAVILAKADSTDMPPFEILEQQH